MHFNINTIQTDAELHSVLSLCKEIFGEQAFETEYYSVEAWQASIPVFSDVLLYAMVNGEIASAVLGRPGSEKNLAIGVVACAKKYRMRGITKALIKRFENNAEQMGFKYITLGALAESEGFYLKCGYKAFFKLHGQNIYQKDLLNCNKD